MSYIRHQFIRNQCVEDENAGVFIQLVFFSLLRIYLLFHIFRAIRLAF